MSWGGITPQQILQGLGDQATHQNVQDLLAWQRAEGGGASNNPFNTTQQEAGAGQFNSVGVRNYGSASQGLQATLQTLRNGHYGGILKVLQRGGNGGAFAQAVGSSPWGTQGSLIASVLGTKLAMPPKGGAVQGFGHAAKTGVTAPTTHTRFDAATYRRQAGLLLMQQATAEAAGQPTATDPTTGQPVDILSALEKARQAATIKVTSGGSVQTGAGSTPGLPSEAKGHGIGAKAVQMAMKQIGVPYVWGGENAKGKAGGAGGGFDCSGLVQWAYGALGVKLPRVAADQGKAGKPVAYNNLKPGDLLVEGNGDHVVMYAGNGQVIQAPHTGTSVQMSPLSWFPSGQYNAVRPY